MARLRRTAQALPWLVAGAVIALFGFAALIAAAHEWLALRMTPLAAHLVIAGVLLAIAVVAILVGMAVRARRGRPALLTNTALVAAPMAARAIAGRVSLGTVALAAVVAIGAIVGRSLARED
jgi:uncharacterized membrane protein (DUF485 family)